MKLLAKISLFLSSLALVLTIASGILLPMQSVHAQIDTSLEDVGLESGLSDQSLTVTIGNIISTFLSVLGVIALILVLYGGFVWMTAGGDSAKVDKAKGIMINAVIGLIIILISFAITSFVINALTVGSGTGTGTGSGSGSGSSSGLGGGSVASFAVSSFSPEGEVSIRNVVPRITFSRQIDQISVEGNVVITNTVSGDVIDGTLAVWGNRISFTPTTACPAPNEDRFCFDSYTQYTVTVDSGIESTTGVSLLCSSASCTSTFTTGDLVDVDDPVALISYPDNGASIPVDSFTLVQVDATDDSEVSTAEFYGNETWFDSVAASGSDLSDVTIESVWYTDGLSDGTRYSVDITVTDIAGNEDNDSIRVLALPAFCFDGTISGDETAVDCGGSCGACDGSACTESIECSSGVCELGSCISYPEIESISPANGAVGTFVTIAGEGFRSSGTVTFSDGAGGAMTAPIPSCVDDWSQTQIIVEVPEGAGDGPITVTTSTGTSDSTDDDFGILISDFDVNDTERPNLCQISPSTAQVGDSVTASGFNFGSTQGSSFITFDSRSAGSYSSWSDTAVAMTVPVLTSGDYVDVSVSVNGISSNTVSFGVEYSDEDLPTIYSLSPNEGGVGQYVTISGTNFGSGIGSVWFYDPVSGYFAAGSIDFPSACADSFWSVDQITIIVPAQYTNGVAINESEHQLYITTQLGVDSEVTSFTVNADDPTPGICAIDPDIGEVDDAVVIYGDNFGSSRGSVNFYNGVSATVATGDWGDSSIETTVPSSTQTGPVTVTSAGGIDSNTVNFEVGTATDVTATTVNGGYAWTFSTGAIPITPELIIACSSTVISAVPNSAFTREACTNSILRGTFNTLINESTLNTSSILVYECDGTSCREDEDALVPADSVVVSSSTSQTSFIWTADSSYSSGEWKTSTTYKVVITSDIASVDGINLDNDVSWTFTTSASSVNCDVEDVIVSPYSDTISESGYYSEFNALPVTSCQVLDPTDYIWDWDTDPSSYIRINSCEDISESYCAQAEALFEGTTTLSAQELASRTEGEATVIVDFTDPYVSNYAPDCDSACVNGQVSLSFNTVMDSSIEDIGSVQLYSCANELCVTLSPIDTIAHCSLVDGCAEVTLDIVDLAYTGELNPSSFYRVVLSGLVVSQSGVALTRTNYGDDFSWTFGTSDDDSLCSVNRIVLSPENILLNAVGETQPYEISAYGSPDQCSVAGQELNAYGYDWQWTTPIVDDADVSEWITIAGSLLDVGQSSVPAGCTASCLAQGSSAYDAICGDWITDIGEDCEDGNVADGDGCSSRCLNEGTEACSYTCTGTSTACASDTGCQETCDITDTETLTGICSISLTNCSTSADCALGSVTCDATSSACCGDGDVDLHEECDDGAVVDGDGCSSICLNEGSRAVGATCGNGDIAHEYLWGGEECDDGNATSGDGCSAICLNEGSTAITEILAQCGDSTIDVPYETCDDGNLVNGDGCSSSCLKEGGSGSYGDCGNRIVEVSSSGAGEECDGTQGCTADCLLAGSSVLYSSVSVCGDGTQGTGELAACEDSLYGAGPDDAQDPVQVAQILDSAVELIDVDTQRATSTIEVSYGSLDASTSLYLSCVAENDDDCQAGYGVADSKCCMERPDPSLFPNGSQACRNAEIYGLFNTKMNLASFTNNVYLQLNLGSGDSCPSAHTVANTTSSSWWTRVATFVRRIIAPFVNAQTTGDCIIPIDSVSQVQTTDGTYKVSFHYSTLLEPNASYTIHVLGDTLGDSTKTGVLSYYLVAMDGDASQSFTTYSDICGLDAVEIEDSNSDSPNLFTQTSEQHIFTASAYSYDTGSEQSLEPISGIYEWGWTSWSSDDTSEEFIQQVSQTTGIVPQAEVIYSAVGNSGEAVIVTSAVVTTDSSGESFTCSSTSSRTCLTDSDCPDEEVCEAFNVSGSAQLTALVCENPWPALSYFPFEDNVDGLYPGVNTSATRGRGWMNFSMYYCRDNGDDALTSDDYPELRVVAGKDRGTDEILKEYFLNIYDNEYATGDAIGVRIVMNEQYLSPLSWYYANGFSGSPTEMTIDGFSAIQDGRSVYVSVPNYWVGSIYPNILILSYNLGADLDTVDIFNQLLDNISFITNVRDIALCYDPVGGSYSGTCASDFDCQNGWTCSSDKLKLERDIKRLTDITDIASLVPSATAQLESGTYVRSMDSSVWSSWDEVLSSEIGEDIAQDPLNQYVRCGTGLYASYDATTCVNQTTGAYVCPAQSYTYHYRALGSSGFELGAELEFRNGSWASDIDQNTSDTRNIIIGAQGTGNGFENGPAFCDGTTVWGVSDTCGDGIVGSGEYCEVDDTGVGSACTSSSGLSGYYVTTCNSTCLAFETTSTATCSPISCGNGIIETGEDCDDGSFNGRYGFCGADCSDADRVYCGDGSLAGGELCDCGSTGTPSGAAYGGGTCSLLNGVYDLAQANTCAWDCAGPGPYCGDIDVDDAEECDGNTDSYDETLCSVGSSDDDKKCSVDTDCVNIWGRTGTCGGTVATDNCPYTTVCVDGVADNIGLPCTTDSSCGTGGICSTYAYQTTRTRTCDDSDCTWQEDWENIACKAPGSCGDGTVDDGEECDDGNDDSSDSCTVECTENVCGDGYLYAGEEQCDEGANNGVLCTASYGSTCSYCNELCKAVSTSGDFCGDSVINGAEVCDGSDVPYHYVPSHYVSLVGSYEVGGTCDSYGAVVDGSTCLQVGVCNGGSANGENCVMPTISAIDPCAIFGGTCELPVCSVSCGSMCPFSYTAQRLMIKTNMLGASRSYSADISPYGYASTILSAGNSSSLYVPACSVASGLRMTINEDDRNYPNVEIMLVLDRSNSMADCIDGSSSCSTGDTRIGVLQSAVDEAITTLFDSYDGTGATMKIGWAYIAGLHDYSTTSADDKTFLMMSPDLSEEAIKLSITSGLVTGGVNGTPIYQSIEDAMSGFSGSADEEYLVIFTDGNIYNRDYSSLQWSDIGLPVPAFGSTTLTASSYMHAVSNEIDDIKAQGVHVYTAVLTATPCDITQMQRWSDMDCTSVSGSCSGMQAEGNYICVVPEDGITYAYDATNAAGLQEMYQEIVNSILNITISTTFAGQTESTTVAPGSNLSIDIPSTFACTSSEQTVTLRTSFSGSGTINLSNITLNMCTQ